MAPWYVSVMSKGHECQYSIPTAWLMQAHTRKDARFSLKASYMEIYNEAVFDLINFSPKAKSLPVKWDASYGFYVQGLRVVPCAQQRTMMEVRLLQRCDVVCHTSQRPYARPCLTCLTCHIPCTLTRCDMHGR